MRKIRGYIFKTFVRLLLLIKYCFNILVRVKIVLIIGGAIVFVFFPSIVNGKVLRMKRH